MMAASPLRGKARRTTQRVHLCSQENRLARAFERGRANRCQWRDAHEVGGSRAERGGQALHLIGLWLVASLLEMRDDIATQSGQGGELTQAETIPLAGLA